MFSTLTTISSKQKAAADAGRINRAKQRRNERQQAKNRSLRPQLLRNWPGEVHPMPAPGSEEEEDDDEVPQIHPALGRWPENWVPNIYWDLSNPGTWIYKRPFTEEELESSPFLPEQKKMIILLRPDQAWSITIKPRTGNRFITLRCFQEAMITALQQDVPRTIWFSAGARQKHGIAMAFFRRTGNLPIVPSIDVFEKWKNYLIAHADSLEVTDHILGQMTEFVTRGATRTMTRLQTVDLLGYNYMFAGLTYLKENDWWVMSTTRRHIARMAHHMLPRPTMVPTMVPNAMPNMAPSVAPGMVPIAGPVAVQAVAPVGMPAMVDPAPRVVRQVYLTQTYVWGIQEVAENAPAN